MEREQAKTIDTLIHIHLDEAREGGKGRGGDSRRVKHVKKRSDQHTHIRPGRKQKTGSPAAADGRGRGGRKERGVPNPLSAASQQVCGGGLGGGGREKRGWNSNTGARR